MRSNITDYTVILVRDTQKAALVTDGATEVWLPKSKIEIEETGKHDERLRPYVIVSIPDWLAKEKGLA